MLLRLANNDPELAISDPERFEFENDRRRMDEFFAVHGYFIIAVDVNSEESYRIRDKGIYVLGKDFLDDINSDRKHLNRKEVKGSVQTYINEAHDRIIMSLRCIKDLVQEIENRIYINPYTNHLKRIFEILGYNVILKKIISEGGLFLKGNPSKGKPFLIISHDFIDYFMELGIDILKSPENIGSDPLDSHIDTYLGIINFKEKIDIKGSEFNGILYIHSDSLKNIQNNLEKKEQWNSLKNEMKMRDYFIKEYIAKTPAQNIGINFKFDRENNNLLTNAFPKKEKDFLQMLGINVLAPEYNYSTNDCFSGGINCSYIFIHRNVNLRNKIINWIKGQKSKN
ncbi:MAG: hypothetical protein GF329_00935 [Candidatus Lokiarchaeota archaeon]|nr:hypothetical protein [Candidatus Lokiarchaeota archaeon]